MKFERETAIGLAEALYVCGAFGAVLWGIFWLAGIFPIVGTILFWYIVALVSFATIAEVASMFDKTKYHLDKNGEVMDCWENILKMGYWRYVAFDLKSIYWKQLKNIADGMFELSKAMLECLKDFALSIKNVILFIWITFTAVTGLRLFYNRIEAVKYAELARKAEPKFEKDILDAWSKARYSDSLTYKQAYKKAKGKDRELILNIFMAKSHIRKDLPLYNRIKNAIK